MENREILSILGLARKAGKLVYGHDAVLRNFQRGKLLIISLDYSRRESSYLRRLAVRNNIPVLFLGTKSEFGRIFGSSPTGVILITDRHFANKIKKLL